MNVIDNANENKAIVSVSSANGEQRSRFPVHAIGLGGFLQSTHC